MKKSLVLILFTFLLFEVMAQPLAVIADPVEGTTNGRAFEPSEQAHNAKPKITYLSTSIENGSKLNWELDKEGTVHIYLGYDYERQTLNRSYHHWHFLLEAAKGTDATLIFHNFNDIYNGKVIRFRTWIMDCVISPDGKKWEHAPVEWVEGDRMKLTVHMDSDSLYIARAEPYRLSDLEKLCSRVKNNRKVKFIPIGHSVEGRPLQIIQVGKDDTPHRVFIRARAHAWEPGGNWVMEGIIKTLLQETKGTAGYLDNYTVYILPMANIDGVARGVSRFNVNGMDLNRNLDKPADPVLCPENAAMEGWLEKMVSKGTKPDLAIDFHNDSSGPLLFAPSGKQSGSYVKHMELLEGLLRENTWFSEGTAYSGSAQFGDGLLSRYGIDALVYELNAHWIKSLEKRPLSEDWLLLGEQLCGVFDKYFKELKK